MKAQQAAALLLLYAEEEGLERDDHDPHFVHKQESIEVVP